MEVVVSLSQGRTAAAQCGLFTHKSVPVIFEPPCITYSECVSVASIIQRAMGMRHIVICGLSGFTVFFLHYLINGTIFEKKLLNINCVF